MVRFLFIIFVVPRIVCENFENLEHFVACITSTTHAHGLNHDSVVIRSNSTFYNRLNFQEQLYPRQIHPLAYVLPKTEGHVQVIVTCANRHGLKVTPKSGGHSDEKYSYGNDFSIVVDLRYLKRVRFHGEREAVVGSGTDLETLLRSLWTLRGAFVPTGSCPTVGIGGHATGGGHGFLARTYGLTLDHIVGMRIVIANGSLLVANASTNPDLFWALRGAGAQSFGIVASFQFKTVPAPGFVTVQRISFTLDQFPEVYKSWQLFTVNGTRNVSGELNVYSNRVVELYLFDPFDLPESFNCLPPFPPARSTVTEKMTYLQFLDYQFYRFPGDVRMTRSMTLTQRKVKVISKPTPPGKSFYIKNLLNSHEILKVHQLLMKIPPSVTIWFEAYGGAINDVGETDTAFVHRTGRLANAVMNFEPSETTGETEDDPGWKWIVKFYDFFEHSETYQNYVDAHLSNFGKSYFGYNLKKLIRIKRKYDPDNYFSYEQSIPVRNK